MYYPPPRSIYDSYTGYHEDDDHHRSCSGMSGYHEDDERRRTDEYSGMSGYFSEPAFTDDDDVAQSSCPPPPALYDAQLQNLRTFQHRLNR